MINSKLNAIRNILIVVLYFLVLTNVLRAQSKILDRSEADQIVQDVVFNQEVVGITAGILEGDNMPRLYAAGYADLENKKLARPDMIHRIASISKPMTAVAIMQLIEKGKLGLEDPIRKYIPYFPETSKGIITIRHLLEHSSGIDAYANNAESAPITNYPSLKEAIAVFQDRPLLYVPGTEYHYTTYGYVVLGAIIEKVSGLSYRAYMHENIWSPAGMADTDVEIFGESHPRKAKLYTIGNSGKFAADKQTNLSVKVPGGGMQSTVEDLLKFGRAILQNTLLSQSSLNLMIQSSGKKKGGNPYGLGWFLYGTPEGKNGRMMGHSGSQSGTSTQLFLFLDKKLVVVALSNTSGVWNNVFEMVDNLSGSVLQPNKYRRSMAKVLKRYFINDEMNEGLEFYEKNQDDKNYKLEAEGLRDVAYYFINRNRAMDGLKILKLIAAKWPENKAAIDEGVMISIANQLADQNLIDEAMDFLAVNMKVHHDSEAAHRVYGDMHLKKNEYETAYNYYKKSAEISPKTTLFNLPFQPIRKYSSIILPSDTMEVFVYQGDFSKDTAFIFVQGGPLLALNNEGYDPLLQMSGGENMLRIYPYQTQVLDPTILAVKPRLTKAQSTEVMNGNAEILKRTIAYLKSRNKTVFLLGHSFGTSISQEYLYQHENQADKVVLMGLTMDKDPRNHLSVPSGKFVRWRDGEEPYQKDFFAGIPKDFRLKKDLDRILDNMAMIIKVHAEKRFTELLENHDLSNVIYVHGRFDEAIGKTSDEELNFLHRKGIKVIERFGDHHSMLNEEMMTNLYHHLAQDDPIIRSVAAAFSRTISKYGIVKAKEIITTFSEANNYYPISENEFNTLGYYYLTRDRVEEALATFEINVSMFPRSWNAYDSLGEAHVTAGNTENAIKLYEQSLELNPENTFGIEALKKLRAGDKVTE